MIQAGRSLLAAAAVALVATGCSTLARPRLELPPFGLPLRAEAAGVPFFPQEDDYCGPAALATVLGWSGLTVTPEGLVGQAFTPGRGGTFPSDLVGTARRHGRLAVLVATLPDVLRELSAGHPVIVFQNLGLSWFPRWHFAVAVGYDLERGELSLYSGRERGRRVALGTFDRTWARGNRWAVVVLPPYVLPATADDRTVVAAAAGLERARRFAEGATAYGTITDRWPDSYPALLGLGNVRYALGDFDAAEDAYRRAIAGRPHDPAAWNNLAHALAKRGRRDEAVEAARTAVSLASGNAASYEATLQELSQK